MDRAGGKMDRGCERASRLLCGQNYGPVQNRAAQFLCAKYPAKSTSFHAVLRSIKLLAQREVQRIAVQACFPHRLHFEPTSPDCGQTISGFALVMLDLDPIFEGRVFICHGTVTCHTTLHRL